MRGRHLIKLFKALEMLSNKSGVTIEDLGKTLQLDRRSVYRLLRTVEDLGFPFTMTRQVRIVKNGGD